MDQAESRLPGTTVPTDYVEFYSMFHSKIKAQVGAFNGINFNDIEDITNDIIMQFIAGRYLEVYSVPTQQAHAEARYQEQMEQYEAGDLTYKPTKHKGLFSSFVYEFTKRRLLGIRDRTNRRFQKEGKSLDQFFEQNEDEEENSLIGLIGHWDHQYFAADLRSLLKNSYKSLEFYTLATDTRNLPELFQAICTATFMEKDGFNREVYAASKGITVSAVSMQIRDLRDHLRSFGLDKDLAFLLNYRSKAEMCDKDSK